MGGCDSKPVAKRRRSSRKDRTVDNSRKQEEKPKEQKVQEPVATNIPKVEEEASLTTVEMIYKKYGENGIKVILAKQDSKYQSLSYIRINQRCDELVNDLEEEGHKVIDEHKVLSENDFNEVIKSLEEKNQDGIKKTQARTRKTMKQLLQFDEQIAKYEDSRTIMKEKFEDEKIELKQVIKKETREHEKINIDENIPEFDEEPKQVKEKMIEEAQEKYGKKWVEKEEEEKQKKSKSFNYQFDFSHNHRPKFEALIPREECQEKRTEIKEYFEAAGRDCMETNNICC